MSSEDDIIERLLAVDPPENPVGMALCLLTIDLQRVSGNPVDEKLLRRILPRCIATDDVDDAIFQAGLAWSARRIPETDISLVRVAGQSEGSRAWEAHPAVMAVDSRRRRPLHSAVVEMLALRATALLKEQSEEAAIEYLRTAAQAHPDAAGAAGFIGNAFLQLGGITTGTAFMMIVIENGEPEFAAAAAGMLAGKLEDAGDLEGAAMALRHLVDMNLPEYLPRAAFTLAGWLTRLGRPEEACQYFRLAVDSGDPDYAAKAAGALGELLLRQGRIAEAAEALRIAGQGDDELSVHAVGLLGDALWQLGDLQGAELAYSNVVASADADLAARASFALSGVRSERGDARGAADALRFVMQSSNQLVAKAGVELGRLLRELGDRAGARQAWEEALQTGHPEHAPTAAYMLGLQLEIDGDYEGACRGYRVAAQAPASEYGAQAALNLGNLASKNGDQQLAEQGWRLAADSGHPEHAPAAALLLGALLQETEDLEGACRAYQQAAESNLAQISSIAALKLGYLLEQLGDEEGAIAAFQRARSWQDPRVFGRACYQLGTLLFNRGETELARAAFDDIIQSGDDKSIGPARVALGVISLKSGDHEAAADAFIQAIDTIPPDDKATLPGAKLRLALLLRDHQEQYVRVLRDASEHGAEYAVIGLSSVLEHDNQVLAAKQVCELAIASGRTGPARVGAVTLARLVRVYEDIPSAKEALAFVRAARLADSSD